MDSAMVKEGVLDRELIGNTRCEAVGTPNIMEISPGHVTGHHVRMPRRWREKEHHELSGLRPPTRAGPPDSSGSWRNRRVAGRRRAANRRSVRLSDDKIEDVNNRILVA